jgi:hypothetical protein
MKTITSKACSMITIIGLRSKAQERRKKYVALFDRRHMPNTPHLVYGVLGADNYV